MGEVADFLNIPLEKVLKTLLYETEAGVVAVVLRGDHEVNEVKLKNFLKVNDLALATEATVRRETGAGVGFAGPLSLKVPIYADFSLRISRQSGRGRQRGSLSLYQCESGARSDHQRICRPAAGNRRRSLSPLRRALWNSSGALKWAMSSSWGTNIPQAMKATYLDAQGQEQPMYMGCYGIGVSRIVAAAIEQNNDPDGIIFPMPLAPFQILLVPIAVNDAHTMEIAGRLYRRPHRRGSGSFV